MDAKAPFRVIPVFCAPKKAPCPTCGRLGRRKRKHQRQVRTIAYKEIAVLEITYGEYQARCDCCKSFRTHPDEVLPKAKYDNKVREAVLEGILEDNLNVEAVRRRMQRDFLLDLSTGFVYDCLHDAARQLDMGEHRQQVLERFSCVLCVDELHLGKFTLLLATDPIGDFPVAFALVSANDQAHMERFLGNLQRWGLSPKVVVTDGSPLYPSLLAQLWKDAEHQLCVFHVMQDLNKLILDAVRRLRASMGRQGRKGRRRKRGRPSKATKCQRLKQGRTLKEKSKFIFKHRYLIVKRRENMREQEKKDLQTVLEYLPSLRSLRKFADKLHRLFEPEQSEHQAWCRWHALQSSMEFKAIPELAKALASLEEEKFVKMIAFLRGPARDHRWPRTNNHVERCNRTLRFWEKIRYKWRRRRNVVRYLVLAMDRWWKKAFNQPPPQKRSPGSQGRKRKVAAKPEPIAA
ncbi:MAG: transposase [Bdellovibrionales bacterium]